MALNTSHSQLCHNFTLRVSTEPFESRILSSLYILLTLEYRNTIVPLKILIFFTKMCTSYMYIHTVAIMLVYVIAWVAIVFGINCASNVGRKLVIVRALLLFPAYIMRAINYKYYGRHLNSHALGVRHTHLTQISLMAKLLTHHNLEISRIKTIKTP